MSTRSVNSSVTRRISAMISCTSGRSAVYSGTTQWCGGSPSRKFGFGGLSRKCSSLISSESTSTRKPSTPRSGARTATHRTSLGRTSGFRQFRSGCSEEHVIVVLLRRASYPTAAAEVAPNCSAGRRPCRSRQMYQPRFGCRVEAGSPKPGMAIGCVVRHEVQNDVHAPCMSLRRKGGSPRRCRTGSPPHSR